MKDKKKNKKTEWKSAEDRQLSILSSAIDVFLENGVARTTMKDIAEREGISEAGVYKYFRNKREIFEKLSEIGMQINHSLWDRIAEKSPTILEDFKSGLKWILQEVLEVVIKSRKFFLLLQKEYTDPHLKPILQKQDEYLYGVRIVEQLFKKAQDKQVIREDVRPSSMAYTFFNITKAILGEIGFLEYELDTEPSEEEILQLMEDQLKIFLTGVNK